MSWGIYMYMSTVKNNIIYLSLKLERYIKSNSLYIGDNEFRDRCGRFYCMLRKPFSNVGGILAYVLGYTYICIPLYVVIKKKYSGRAIQVVSDRASF